MSRLEQICFKMIFKCSDSNTTTNIHGKRREFHSLGAHEQNAQSPYKDNVYGIV